MAAAEPDTTRGRVVVELGLHHAVPSRWERVLAASSQQHGRRTVAKDHRRIAWCEIVPRAVLRRMCGDRPQMRRRAVRKVRTQFAERLRRGIFHVGRALGRGAHFERILRRRLRKRVHAEALLARLLLAWKCIESDRGHERDRREAEDRVLRRVQMTRRQSSAKRDMEGQAADEDAEELAATTLTAVPASRWRCVAVSSSDASRALLRRVAKVRHDRQRVRVAKSMVGDRCIGDRRCRHRRRIACGGLGRFDLRNVGFQFG